MKPTQGPTAGFKTPDRGINESIPDWNKRIRIAHQNSESNIAHQAGQTQRHQRAGHNRNVVASGHEHTRPVTQDQMSVNTNTVNTIFPNVPRISNRMRAIQEEPDEPQPPQRNNIQGGGDDQKDRGDDQKQPEEPAEQQKQITTTKKRRRTFYNYPVEKQYETTMERIRKGDLTKYINNDTSDSDLLRYVQTLLSYGYEITPEDTLNIRGSRSGNNTTAHDINYLIIDQLLTRSGNLAGTSITTSLLLSSLRNLESGDDLMSLYNTIEGLGYESSTTPEQFGFIINRPNEAQQNTRIQDINTTERRDIPRISKKHKDTYHGVKERFLKSFDLTAEKYTPSKEIMKDGKKIIIPSKSVTVKPFDFRTIINKNTSDLDLLKYIKTFLNEYAVFGDSTILQLIAHAGRISGPTETNNLRARAGGYNQPAELLEMIIYELDMRDGQLANTEINSENLAHILRVGDDSEIIQLYRRLINIDPSAITLLDMGFNREAYIRTLIDKSKLTYIKDMDLFTHLKRHTITLQASIDRATNAELQIQQPASQNIVETTAEDDILDGMIDEVVTDVIQQPQALQKRIIDEVRKAYEGGEENIINTITERLRSLYNLTDEQTRIVHEQALTALENILLEMPTREYDENELEINEEAPQLALGNQQNRRVAPSVVSSLDLDDISIRSSGVVFNRNADERAPPQPTQPQPEVAETVTSSINLDDLDDISVRNSPVRNSAAHILALGTAITNSGGADIGLNVPTLIQKVGEKAADVISNMLSMGGIPVAPNPVLPVAALAGALSDDGLSVSSESIDGGVQSTPVRAAGNAARAAGNVARAAGNVARGYIWTPEQLATFKARVAAGMASGYLGRLLAGGKNMINTGTAFLNNNEDQILAWGIAAQTAYSSYESYRNIVRYNKYIEPSPAPGPRIRPPPKGYVERAITGGKNIIDGAMTKGGNFLNNYAPQIISWGATTQTAYNSYDTYRNIERNSNLINARISQKPIQRSIPSTTPIQEPMPAIRPAPTPRPRPAPRPRGRRRRKATKTYIKTKTPRPKPRPRPKPAPTVRPIPAPTPRPIPRPAPRPTRKTVKTSMKIKTRTRPAPTPRPKPKPRPKPRPAPRPRPTPTPTPRPTRKTVKTSMKINPRTRSTPTPRPTRKTVKSSMAIKPSTRLRARPTTTATTRRKQKITLKTKRVKFCDKYPNNPRCRQ